MTPIVKLLRLMDGEKPAMGKVYDRMFMIGNKIGKREISWKDKAEKIHSERWEYLHSPIALGRLCTRPRVHGDD